MTIESIFLHAPAETFNPNHGPNVYALQLATFMGARLTGLVLELDVVSPKSWSKAQGSPVAATEPQPYNAQALAVAESLRQSSRVDNIVGEFITEHSHAHTVPRVMVDYARMADVSVSGTNSEGLLSELTLAEYILFQSGRPLIVVPQHYSRDLRFEHVVVAWDFSRNAARALGDALPFLRRAKSISVVTFGDDKELESSLTGEHLVASLAARGIKAQFEHADRHGKSIDEALNGLALAQSADLLVMGGFGHSRFHELVLGGATRGILRNPVVPTLLSH